MNNIYVDNYIGKKYGRLTIVEYAGKSQNNSHKVLCKCDCGNTTETLLCRVLNGKTKSCGCLKYETLIQRNSKHSLYHTHLYRVYIGIKNRCLNKNDASYKRYGAKGVTICDDWLGENGFLKFYKWSMKNGYFYDKLPNGRSLLTIDRIDNNKGYLPSNCRWVTNEVQARNKKTTVYVEIDGKKVNLRQYAEEHNIPFMTIYNRIKYLKIPIEDAIKNIDLRKHKRVMEV